MEIPTAISDSLSMRFMFCKKVAFQEYDLDWVTQPFPVLAMIIAGNGMVTVADGENTSIVSEAMDPYFLRPYVMRQPAITAEGGFEVLVTGFSVEILGGVDLLNFYDLPLKYTGKEKEELASLMVQLAGMHSAPTGNDLRHVIQQKKILFEIVEILVRNAAVKKNGMLLNTEEYGCLPAVEYLKVHYADPFDLEQLKTLCHFSHSHFFRLFKKLTGVSPKNYQKDRRIEAAQQLLLTTSHSVAEIGERVGWHDQFHFSRIFKARTGYSPRQFKNQFKLG